MTETATAANPTEANASVEASATLLAQAGTGTGERQQTQTATTQTATATETQANAATKTETAKAGAPEKYDFKAPEGTEYDSELLEAFTGAARKADLTQDAAQKLIEEMAPAMTARQADQVKAIHEGWRTASSADKEFGGEKLAENLGVARKALDTFGTPDLRKLLDETGLGNHPEVIRMLYKAGKAISEDAFVGGKGRGEQRDPVSVLYDAKK